MTFEHFTMRIIVLLVLGIGLLHFLIGDQCCHSKSSSCFFHLLDWSSSLGFKLRWNGEKGEGGRKAARRLDWNGASLDGSLDSNNASFFKGFFCGPCPCDPGHLRRYREAHHLHLPAQGRTDYLLDPLLWSAARMSPRFDRRELLSKKPHRSLPQAGPRVLRDCRAVQPRWDFPHQRAATYREAPGKWKHFKLVKS